MKNENKENDELLQELMELRQRVIELEASETTWKETERELRESEERYRSLIGNIPDVIWTTDLEGNTTFISDNIERVYGYNAEEVYQDGEHLWLGRIHPDDVGNVKEAYGALFAGGEEFDIEYRIQRKDGVWICLHDRSIVTYEKDGVWYTDGMFSEVTDRKRAEEALQKTAYELADKARELERANKELKDATTQLVQSEKMTALGELVAGMAHELNQPLNGIKIICQSILRDKEKNRLDVEDLEQDLGDVVGQVDRMAEIIDHMRVYARRPEVTPMKKIDMKTAMEGPLKIIGQQLKNHNIEVTKELSPELMVMGDLIRLEQVFLNLITNARNAVENNGKESKKIKLRAYRNSDRKTVVAEVMDNGIGVPENLQGKIFQPFFTTMEPGKGTGMGLSVASKIIEEHKGEIELESQIGEGAAFRVILPVVD